MPDTYVYVVPDVDEEIYFCDGWWRRPWQGRWYRSMYYNTGWGFYETVPGFYQNIPPDWRINYRERIWNGHPWNYQRISHEQLQNNWKQWRDNRHWEHEQPWGVEGLKPGTQTEYNYLKEQPEFREREPEHQKQKFHESGEKSKRK